MAAGAIAEALDLAPNTLTFHFDRLRMAGLATVRREGRSMIYAARFETMNALVGFLTENCCGGVSCAPAPPSKPARKRSKISGLKGQSMKRLHVHVSVDDLSRSIGFYSALFASDPRW